MFCPVSRRRQQCSCPLIYIYMAFYVILIYISKQHMHVAPQAYDAKKKYNTHIKNYKKLYLLKLDARATQTLIRHFVEMQYAKMLKGHIKCR